jgi:ABC-type transport system involved in multi-copper enzyme maturation permease subunit
MSPLLRKETRMLLPAWIAALLSASLPLCHWRWQNAAGISLILLPVAMIALALSPFGQETSYGTFGLLLVQPEDRRRFWRVKTRLLTFALVSAWTLFALCLWIARGWPPGSDAMAREDLISALKMSALITFLAFSGGLWTTLLLRDMVSALFCTVLAPIIIFCATTTAFVHWIGPQSDQFSTIAYGVQLAYAAAGFLWARRLFLGAQDVPWTGGQISLRSVRGVALRWPAFEMKGGQNQWTALVKKELQLQEITMFLVLILTLLHSVALAILYFAPQWIGSKLPTELVLQAIPRLWSGVVPLLIGCVAVAEERRFHTLESLLCLPVSKRASFAVKLAVILIMGIVLGGIIPWVLAHFGGVAFGGVISRSSLDQDELHSFVETAALLTGVAFYASTMSRSLLQALSTALFVLILTVLVFDRFWDTIPAFNGIPPFPFLAWSAMTLFCWLGFKNYKCLQIGWRVWIDNIIRAAVLLACVTVTACWIVKLW